MKPTIIRAKIVWFALLVTICASESAHAHKLGQSYTFLKVYSQEIQGRFEMTMGDLNTALGLDFRTDLSVTRDEVAVHIDAIKAYMLEKIRMTSDGVPLDIRPTGYRLLSVSFAQYVLVEFMLDNLPSPTTSLDIDYTVLFDRDPEHRGLLVIEHNWRTSTFNNESTVSLIFSPSTPRQHLDLSSSSVVRGFIGLTRLGMDHIWAGIDHILFLLALLLPSVAQRKDGRWEPVGEFRAALIYVIKIVTFFTVAHSITLSLAALGLVQLPSRVVESIIAVSIAVAAIDIIVPVLRGRVWWVVFVFGLFHGFGFATVLSTMGISSTYMALSLFGFNLGVEIGQVVIVGLVFPLLYVLSRTRLYTPYMLGGSAIMLMLISLYWFIERAFDVDIPTFALLGRLAALWT